MTFYVVFGQSGGLNFEWTKRCKRICLWKVAFCIWHNDVEVVLDLAMKEIKHLRENNENKS
jgi:hypothetical protein